MNRENEEQRPVPQTICGALQKEPNCKCLVLSVLIYGCLAAVTWCRCANVTKVYGFFLYSCLCGYLPISNSVVINFSRYPIKSTKHVSPCDDGYIYIPVAFMGMLYLVYLVECYHSPIRIDLLHAENQDSVLSKLSQLKSAQPTIWWKAISYHYVRRKRQITRYRNGDNYTTTQVYYERINTHAATSFYYYDFCGVKDISKELILDPKVPITKITLTKGFAFSNMRSATEFEEARSRFFAEQELRDDYMEMREGLDLGYNPNPTTLVAVLGNPWFTNRYVYWCLSALLLSWPLRVIIEYKTQYADYQVTKLFGINYDTPTGSEPIHASISQLTITQPGSYMLAPSYSEALLMDPVPSERRSADPQETSAAEIVPSYSEALLYERAEQSNIVDIEARFSDESSTHPRDLTTRDCSCPCHNTISTIETNGLDENARQQENDKQSNDPVEEPLMETAIEFSTSPCMYIAQTETGKCGSCGKFSIEAQLERHEAEESEFSEVASGDISIEVPWNIRRGKLNGVMPRDMSEPNLRSRTEALQADTRFLRLNGQSLRNILENDQEMQFPNDERIQESSENKLSSSEIQGKFRLSLSSLDESSSQSRGIIDASKGAIPKRTILRSRVITNPMSSEDCNSLPNSKTYFCLKSILKQNTRRYTLITAKELQNISDREDTDNEGHFDLRSSYHEESASSIHDASTSNATSKERCNLLSRSRESLDGTLGRRKNLLLENTTDDKSEPICLPAKRESTRTLIFASPIQEVCPGDPFGGKDVVQSKREVDSSPTNDAPSQTVLNHIGRSLACDRKVSRRRFPESRKYHYAASSSPTSLSNTFDHPDPYPYALSASSDAVDVVNVGKHEASTRVYQHGMSFPPYEGGILSYNGTTIDQISPGRVSTLQGRTELTRSLTERRTKPVRNESGLRRSFTGRVEDYRVENGKRTNLNMETSL